MKGVILAGGSGSRLMPSTKVTNKHLLPVYDRPMIYYPLELLGRAGIDDVLVVVGEEHAGDFMELLGDGTEISGEERGPDFDGEITYRVQREPLGIAHAVGRAEDFIEPDERFVVVLGDNIFGSGIAEEIREFQEGDSEASIFLKKIEEPERFAVPWFEDGELEEIVEKPDEPSSDLAVTGLYGLYNGPENSLFRYIDGLEVSERGEYEVTDILNWYLDRGELEPVEIDSFWSDAGRPESLLRASRHVKENRD